jgi:ABC-type branched-subunit amino acid transport system substrate-binding protein
MTALRQRSLPPRLVGARYDAFDFSPTGARGRPDRLRIAFLVPLSGPAGLWGPSCQTSAMLAAQEVNAAGGILGREIELVFTDAGAAPQQVAEDTLDLIAEHRAQAVIGMHISAVRVALVRALRGRLPYVYTPVYEGGERSPGLFMVGETPARQLKPAIHWLAEQRRARRWYLIGNDYVWPHVSHRAARRYVKETGGEVVGVDYVPFGCEDHDMYLARIRKAQPDVVLVSMVGTDCVTFNRAFASAGLARQMLRLSVASEENTLLGIGARHAENFYFTAGYLAVLDTPANQAFLDRYHAAFGARRADAQYDWAVLLRRHSPLRGACTPRRLARGGRAITRIGRNKLHGRTRARHHARAPPVVRHLSRPGGRPQIQDPRALPGAVSEPVGVIGSEALRTARLLCRRRSAQLC